MNIKEGKATYLLEIDFGEIKDETLMNLSKHTPSFHIHSNMSIWTIILHVIICL